MENISRDMWKTTLSIGEDKSKENDKSEEERKTGAAEA